LNGSLVLLLYAVVQHRLSRAGTRHTLLTVFGIFTFAVLVVSNGGLIHLNQWLIEAGSIGGMFILVSLWILPNDRSFIPCSMAAIIILRQVEVFLTTSHPYLISGTLLSVLLVFVLAVAWTYLLQRREVSGRIE
jgi:hypothetical protein